MHKDFHDFANSESSLRPAAELERQLLEKIKKDLQPGHIRTFSMLLLVQAIAGTLTLLICPQFGFGFTDGLMHVALAHVNQHLGSQVCTILCSIVFITPGIILATVTLPKPITDNISIWHCIGVAMLLMLPLAIVANASFVAILAWLFGSITVSAPYIYAKNWHGQKA